MSRVFISHFISPSIIHSIIKYWVVSLHRYQAKLQANLMYLAAIADSQPQPPTVQAAQVC